MNRLINAFSQFSGLRAVVLIDNNGTLTNQPYKRLTVPVETCLNMFNQLLSRGVVCGMGTDITLRGTDHFLGHIGLGSNWARVNVCKQGTLTRVQLPGQEPVQHKALSQGEIARLKKMFNRLHGQVLTNICGEHNLLLETGMPAVMPEQMTDLPARLNGHRGVVVRDSTRQLSSSLEIRANRDRQLVVDAGLSREIGQAMQAATHTEGIPDSYVEVAKSFFYSAMPHQHEKADGVRRLRQALDAAGRRDAPIYFFGDSGNDLAVARLARQIDGIVTMAVGNAIDELKGLVHHVMRQPYTEGVMEGLRLIANRHS